MLVPYPLSENQSRKEIQQANAKKANQKLINKLRSIDMLINDCNCSNIDKEKMRDVVRNHFNQKG